MALKQTPLYGIHRRYGGRIVEFGGWSLPVQYTGIKEEHQAVRTKAGLFDVSHMGEIRVEGPDASAFLQKLVTNDVFQLEKNQVLYTPMCYEHGGTVDDLLVYKQREDSYLLVVNASNTEKDWDWLQGNVRGFAAKLTDVSGETAQLALQGPLAGRILSNLTDAPVGGLNYYRFMPEVAVADKKVLLSRTGYTGEYGFELYCRPDDAGDLWEAIMDAGQPLGLLPAGLGCRDTLRFEACFPLYGHELSADISPLEAGIGMFVKLDKGEFNGREALHKQKTNGLARRIAGFEMTGRGVARTGYPVWAEGECVGTVTTGSYAPSLDKNLGLALIRAERAGTGQRLDIEIRDKNVSAQVIAKPFYKREEK
ncbi:MAG TPA: glycine cleavage system aminomethyltransferase GcvT [Selenomonadales bacterium]|nr:glycine cleavage system aminomethyltransferase GcvT [Selenomonadales bacterium]